MTDLTTLPVEQWPRIASLFQNHKRMRIQLDSVFEGYTRDFGQFVSVLTNSVEHPAVAQLTMGQQIFFGGDPNHPAAQTMIQRLPKTSLEPFWVEGFFGALGMTQK